MKKQVLAAVLLCLFIGALSAGLSVGRPGAVKKRVANLDDKVRAAQLEAAVAVNRAPVISVMAAVSTTVAAGGGAAAVSVTASDPDGDALSYLWTSTAGVISGSGANRQWTAPSAAGAYAVTCAVSDGKGGSAQQSVTVAAVPQGTGKWVFLSAAAISSSPAIGPDGIVYAATEGGELYAINPDGSQKWVFTGNADPVDFSPVTDPGGTAYIVSGGTNLYAVNPGGTLKWGPSDVGTVSRAPVIGSDGAIYVADESGAYTVSTVDPATGVADSTFTHLGNILFAPVIGADGTIYIVDGSDFLYSVDPVTGLSTSTELGSSISLPPVIGSTGTVYIIDNVGALYSVDLLADAQFSYDTSEPVTVAPVTGSTGTIYVVNDSDGRLHAVDPAANVESEFSVLPLISFPPVVGPDGTIYVVSGGTDLYAINPDGTPKWGPVVPAGAASITGGPVIGSDGTVYFGASDGKLYAFYGAPAAP